MHGTSKPDMSGYLLAMVARIKPWWVLRENVYAPDVRDFARGLVMLGYRTHVVIMDSAAFTGQSRTRQFVVGFDQQKTLDRFHRACVIATRHTGNSQKNGRFKTPLLALNTRRNRVGPRQNYVYEKRKGLRVLSHAERESLQGLPVGWTDGIPNTARERSVGNAVTVPVAKWLGERIKEAIITNH